MMPTKCVPTTLGPKFTIGTGPNSCGMYSSQYLLSNKPTNMSGQARQHDPVMAKHEVYPARILEQQTNDDKGKAAINDDGAVAQGIEPVQAKERERAREDQGDQRDEQDGRQRRQRADRKRRF